MPKPSRAADPAADWLSVAEARDRVLASVQALPPERLPLLDTLGRVLAEDIVSPVDLPLWDNSAMDGFAVRAADIRGATPARPASLRVTQDIPAGAHPQGPVGAGEAARIMTGAPVPAGADTVVRVEHTDPGVNSGRVRVHADSDAGRNIRRRGEDVRRDTPVLRSGTVLGAAHLALAASVGCSRPTVTRAPRVAVLASGDELCELDQFDQVIAGRRIVSSNSYALAARLRECGMIPEVLGIARDDPADLRRHLERARGCDALISTAGVSVGEHDYLRDVLREWDAEIDFWRVRMRPGSPFAFGRIGGLGGVPWFGLPGNPVSTLVTFEVFVRPALLRMAGHRAIFLPVVPVRFADRYSGPPGLTHFLRVRLDPNTGEARLAGSQSSGVLSAFAAADALLVVKGEAEPGEMLPAVILRGAPLCEVPGY